MNYVHVLSLLAILAETHAVSDSEWNVFKEKYGKTYSNVPELDHRRYYDASKAIVDLCNENFRKRLTTYTCRINQFADMPHEHVRSFLLGSVTPTETDKQAGKLYQQPNKSTRPLKVPYFDWTTKKVISQVQDQGPCASGYAFAAASAIESHFSIHRRRKIPPRSPQQLLDCTSGPYNESIGSINNGCQGGLPSTVFHHMNMINLKLKSEEVYPTTGRKDDCRMDKSGIDIYGHAVIPPENEELMVSLLTTNGPLAAVMDASSPFFLFYETGIYDDAGCSPALNKLTHSVLIVGYSTSASQPFWKIKNSWSTDWGMNGYFHLPRNKNFCGIATHVSYPFVKRRG